MEETALRWRSGGGAWCVRMPEVRCLPTLERSEEAEQSYLALFVPPTPSKALCLKVIFITKILWQQNMIRNGQWVVVLHQWGNWSTSLSTIPLVSIDKNIFHIIRPFRWPEKFAFPSIASNPPPPTHTHSAINVLDQYSENAHASFPDSLQPI